ncbi:MAG: type I 3-dehydroquinate dehydratase [Actinomycetia bacterium]|nr:type I 3-dehydroquinate dehydratase [Actinomycetes bacterium]
MSPTRPTIGDVRLGADRPAAIVPLLAASADDLLAQAQAVAASDADLVEWRADAYTGTTAVPDLAAELRGIVGRPLIGTVRTRAEGGAFDGDDDAYATLVTTLMACQDLDALDVETARSASGDLIAAAHARGVVVIGSHHEPTATPAPADLRALLDVLDGSGADVVKLAVLAATPADSAALLGATAEFTSRAAHPAITMAMGEAGLVTRLIGHRFGSCATFAVVAAASAPGQPGLAYLRAVWAALGDA